MKKTLLITMLLAIAFAGYAQNTVPYLNVKWESIDSVKNDIAERIGSTYVFSTEQILTQAGVAYLKFEDKKNARNIEVTLFKGASGGDADMGIPATPVIRQVNIVGLFVDLYPVYTKMFNVTPPMEDIKAKGITYIPSVKSGNKIHMASFSRESPNHPGYWELVLKIY